MMNISVEGKWGNLVRGVCAKVWAPSDQAPTKSYIVR